MKIPIVGLALFAVIACADAQTTNRVAPEPCRARIFVPESLKQARTVASPDGQYRVILDGYREEGDSVSGKLSVFHRKTSLGQYDLHHLSAGIFVKWSPDSEAFYVMWSNGGTIGGYEVRVFRVSSNEVREMFPMALAENEFRSKHDCETRGVNFFAIKWMGASERLKIAIQVYPTSDCGKQMGFMRGYDVRLVDGAVLGRLSQEMTEKAMKQCPTVIWPTGLWNDDDLQKAKASVAAKSR
jgi:hypothetical protein